MCLINERKKYGIALAENIKALLDELGIKSSLETLGGYMVGFKVDTDLTDEQIHTIYKRTDVNHVHYDNVKKELAVGIEMPPVLGQYAG